MGSQVTSVGDTYGNNLIIFILSVSHRLLIFLALLTMEMVIPDHRSKPQPSQ